MELSIVIMRHDIQHLAQQKANIHSTLFHLNYVNIIDMLKVQSGNHRQTIQIEH